MNESSAIHSVQYCDSTQNLDITGSPSRERDANEVRVWTADAERVVVVEKFLSLSWHITGSDHFNWTEHDSEGFRTARDAIVYALGLMGIPESELDEAW